MSKIPLVHIYKTILFWIEWFGKVGNCILHPMIEIAAPWDGEMSKIPLLQIYKTTLFWIEWFGKIRN